MTHQYELMVILDPEIDERTVAPSLDKFLNVIRNDGGTIGRLGGRFNGSRLQLTLKTSGKEKARNAGFSCCY